MKLIGLTFFIVFSSPSILRNFSGQRYFVVWNVGQGQWATLIDENHCQHFDAGGEFAPFKKIRQRCWKKNNQFFISHWDLDHLSFLSSWRPPNRCLRLKPLGKSSARKEALLSSLQPCIASQETTWPRYTPKDQPGLESNSKSHVLIAENILIPGDSPQKLERKWISRLPRISTAQVLILGHHGSASSTSSELLAHLPKLKITVASARWRRYHHPHGQTLARLKSKNLPVLRTEDWGNIFFLLPPSGAKWPGAL